MLLFLTPLFALWPWYRGRYVLLAPLAIYAFQIIALDAMWITLAGRRQNGRAGMSEPGASAVSYAAPWDLVFGLGPRIVSRTATDVDRFTAAICARVLFWQRTIINAGVCGACIRRRC
jgi:hypothetical protein